MINECGICIALCKMSVVILLPVWMFCSWFITENVTICLLGVLLQTFRQHQTNKQKKIFFTYKMCACSFVAAGCFFSAGTIWSGKSMVIHCLCCCAMMFCLAPCLRYTRCSFLSDGWNGTSVIIANLVPLSFFYERCVLFLGEGLRIRILARQQYVLIPDCHVGAL